MTPERLAETKRKINELAAALAGRSAPAKRIATARRMARTIQETEFPQRACRVIWLELLLSKLNPHSTAAVDTAELRHLAERVKEILRLFAMFPT
jgi:hypothetical protein